MTIKTLRERMEIWNDLLKDAPPEMSVSAEEAAIFLCVSEKTIARMRQNATGPKYIQPQTSTGSKARNQKVTYKIKDLNAWQHIHSHDSTVGVLVDRGILSFDSMVDLLEPNQPFWIKTVQTEIKTGLNKRGITKATEQIMGHLRCASLKLSKQLLADPNVRLKNISLDEAMKRSWSDPEARNPFHNEYVAVLQNSISQSNAQQESAELRSV
jgi:hypothetical protein